MRILAALLGFTFVAPAGWTAQSMQQKQHNGWVLVRTYSPQPPADPESIEISRGPLKGLSIGDYAYLEVEGIKHDIPDVVIEVNHEQVMCGIESWVLVYHYADGKNAQKVFETLIGTDRGAYRAVYSIAADAKSDAGAISALNSLCAE